MPNTLLAQTMLQTPGGTMIIPGPSEDSYHGGPVDPTAGETAFLIMLGLLPIFGALVHLLGRFISPEPNESEFVADFKVWVAVFFTFFVLYSWFVYAPPFISNLLRR
jgi:hypothetical protein